MAPPRLKIVVSNEETALVSEERDRTAMPGRAQSAAFGFMVGALAAIAGVLVAVLPGIAKLNTMALLLGGIVFGLAIYQRIDPAPRSVWDVRLGGALLGAGVALAALTATILFSPLFAAAGGPSRAWAASMPGLACLLFCYAGWMGIRRAN